MARELLVSPHLHLDVPRLLHVLLHEDVAVAKRRLRLRAGPFEGLLQLAHLLHHTHAAPAATVRRLDDDGQRVLVHEGACLCHCGDGPGCARHHRHAHLRRQLACGSLVAEDVKHSPRRADEGDAGIGTCLRERRILGQEAVSGVYGLNPVSLGHADELGDVEVGGHTARGEWRTGMAV